MKMTFNLNKIWYGVRLYQDILAKKIDDSTIKDSVTVTSSNFSGNNRAIRILTHFTDKNHSKLPITDKNFSYNLYMSLKSVKKHITPQYQNPLSLAFHKYWQFLVPVCILVELGWVYKSTISKMSNKQWLKFKKWVATTPSPPPSLARYVSRNGLTIGGLTL